MTLLLSDPGPALTAAAAKPTPGGRESWKWQLRDKNGRWIQLGSEISFPYKGASLTGVIIGSTGPGQATVRLPDGRVVAVPTSGVTATGRTPGKEGGGGEGGAAAPAPGRVPAPTPARQVKATLPPESTLPERKPPTAAQRQEARKKAKESRRRRRASGTSRRSERMPPPSDERLDKVHRQSKSIEALIRIAAKKRGRGDPFGDEKEGGGKSKDGGSKDRERDSDEKSPAEKKRKSSSRKRRDTRKKLTQSQIDAVGAIMEDVLAQVKKGAFSAALSRLDRAESLLENTSAPWLLKRINYLQKGLGDLSLTASAALLAYATAPSRSWTWQLRDRLGQWIEMHSEVRWLANGRMRTGRVVDSTGPGMATILDDATNAKVAIPTSRLLSKALTSKGPVSSVSGRSLESKIEAANLPITPPVPITAADYMALRTLRMDTIRTFGGSTSQADPVEYALARDRTLLALDFAARKNVRPDIAAKRLTDARRAIAAARAWAEPDRRERLRALEEQIAQIAERLAPKKQRISAATRLKIREAAANTPVAALRGIDWASGVLDRTGTSGTLLSAASQSWKWQLRDRNGQWIEMGARVKWLAGGLSYDGKVVGSPKEGIALVEDDQGRRVRLPANRLTATEAPPTPTPGETVRVAANGKRPKAFVRLPSAKATQAVKDINDILDTDVDPEDRAEAAEGLVYVARSRIAERLLPKKVRELPAVKAITDRAKAAIDRLDELMDSHPRVAKLVDTAILWADEYFTLGTTPGVGSAFTSIGLPNPFVDPPGFLMAAGDLLGSAINVAEQVIRMVASGQSWRWQLRDKDGQWIDMGSRVSWLVRGARHTGSLTGSPTAGIATVRDDRTGREHNLDERELTALAEPMPEAPEVPVEVSLPDARTSKATITGARPSPVVTSVVDLSPEAVEFVNNGGGTPDDPVHVYEYDATKVKVNKKTGAITPAHPARTLTVRQSDVTAHYRAVVEAALKGEKANVKASLEAIAEAREWYPRAHDVCVQMHREFLEKYPNSGLTFEQVTGVMAAVSPRQRWDQNIVSARKVIDVYLSKGDISSLADLKDDTGAGLHSNVEIGLKILDGTGPEVMTGTKRRSFWNNLTDPSNDYDVTIDGWMASAIWRMGGTFSDGTPVDEKALSWIDHDLTVDKQKVVKSAGYMLLADAVRQVARDLDLRPNEVQAIYWVAVGGGQSNTQMWSNDPRYPDLGPGFNRQGKARWATTNVTPEHPFAGRWIIGMGEDGYPILSPLTTVTNYAYGRFRITHKKTPNGWVFMVNDPVDRTPGHALGSYHYFKTKKGATEWMNANRPDEPIPPYVPPTEPVDTVMDDGVRRALGLPPAGTTVAVSAAAGFNGPVITLDDDGGEWCPPDDYDALAIYDMAQAFQNTTGPVPGMLSAWEITGPHPTAGQIQWCWENPDAWDLIDDEVDMDVSREWFIEQLLTRVEGIAPPDPAQVVA